MGEFAALCETARDVAYVVARAASRDASSTGKPLPNTRTVVLDLAKPCMPSTEFSSPDNPETGWPRRGELLVPLRGAVVRDEHDTLATRRPSLRTGNDEP